MKINMPFSARIGDAEFSDAVRLGDTIKAERRFGVAYQDLEMSVDQMCFLAWVALKRAGKTELDYDAWVDVVDEVTFEGEEPESEGKGETPPAA